MCKIAAAALKSCFAGRAMHTGQLQICREGNSLRAVAHLQCGQSILGIVNLADLCLQKLQQGMQRHV